MDQNGKLAKQLFDFDHLAVKTLSGNRIFGNSSDPVNPPEVMLFTSHSTTREEALYEATRYGDVVDVCQHGATANKRRFTVIYMNVEAAERATAMRDFGKKIQFTSGNPAIDASTKTRICKALKCTCKLNDCQKIRQQFGGQMTLQQYVDCAERGHNLEIPPAPDLDTVDDPTEMTMDEDNHSLQEGDMSKESPTKRTAEQLSQMKITTEQPPEKKQRQDPEGAGRQNN